MCLNAEQRRVKVVVDGMLKTAVTVGSIDSIIFVDLALTFWTRLVLFL